MDRMPTELYIQIFKSTRPIDVPSVAKVCKRWYNIFRHHILRCSVHQYRRYGEFEACSGLPNAKHQRMFFRCRDHSSFPTDCDEIGLNHTASYLEGLSISPPKREYVYQERFDFVHGFLGGDFRFIQLNLGVAGPGKVIVNEVRLGSEHNGRWVKNPGYGLNIKYDRDFRKYLEKVMGRSYSKDIVESTSHHDYYDWHGYYVPNIRLNYKNEYDDDGDNPEINSGDNSKAVMALEEEQEETWGQELEEMSYHGNLEDAEHEPVDPKAGYLEVSSWKETDGYLHFPNSDSPTHNFADLLSYKYRNPRYPEDITSSRFLDVDPLFHPSMTRREIKKIYHRLMVELDPKGAWWKLERGPGSTGRFRELIRTFRGIDRLILDRAPMRHVFDHIAAAIGAGEYWDDPHPVSGIVRRGWLKTPPRFAVRIWVNPPWCSRLQEIYPIPDP